MHTVPAIHRPVPLHHHAPHGMLRPSIEDDAVSTTPSTRTGAWGRTQAVDAVLLGLLAIALRIPAFLADTALHFDDGTYGLSAVAMRTGNAPFVSVYSSQGPVFLPLLHLFDVLGFERMDSPRLLPVLAGAAIAIGVYRIASMLTDRGGALLAGALAAASGVVMWTTAPITSDGVALTFAVFAVAEALNHRSRPATHRAVVVALIIGAAVGTKSLLSGPAILVAWIIVASSRRWRDTVVVPIVAAAFAVATAVPWGVRAVYEQSIAYHSTVEGRHDVLANWHKAMSTLGRRDLTMLVLAAVAAGGGLVAWLRRDRTAGAEDAALLDRWFGGDRFLWWWLLLGFVTLAVDPAMWRNHVNILAPPLALLIACHRPSWRVVAVVLVVTVPLQMVSLRALYRPEPYRGAEAVARDAARAIPASAWALTDTGGYVWRAGRATAPWYVDPSILRIETPVDSIRITSASIARVAARPRVCLVLITSPVRWGSFADLPARLAEDGYRKVAPLGPGTLGVYRRPCRSAR